jgi:hypothetical protein
MIKTSDLPTTFEIWLRNQYTHNELADIANYGAQAGFNCLIYYDETSKLYDHYSDDIWEMIEEDREDFGMQTCSELITSFNGAKDVASDAQFKNLLVWYAAERIAFRLTEGEYISEATTDN